MNKKIIAYFLIVLTYCNCNAESDSGPKTKYERMHESAIKDNDKPSEREGYEVDFYDESHRFQIFLLENPKSKSLEKLYITHFFIDKMPLNIEESEDPNNPTAPIKLTPLLITGVKKIDVVQNDDGTFLLILTPLGNVQDPDFKIVVYEVYNTKSGYIAKEVSSLNNSK